MKRKALLVIGVLAAVAAIVALTTGAIAGTSGRSDQPGDGFTERGSRAAFTSCLASHGVQVPSDDPAVVKRWLSDRQNDPAAQAALQACAGPPDGTEPGPTPSALVACLEQHGVDVPSDVKETPDALKPWLVGAMDQPSVSAAVEACAGGPAPKGQKK
jgi:anti-sigma factor RsiW